MQELQEKLVRLANPANFKKLFRAGLVKGTLAAVVLGIALAALIGGQPAKAGIAGSYQYPCQPWGNAQYGFMQFVSGWGYHTGEDQCHRSGAPIYATADGVVTYSAKTPDSYRWGNLIMIEHTNPDGGKTVSLYGHMSGDRRVAAGQPVGKGQLLGFVGPSYTAENGNWSAHIHFGVHLGGYGAAVGTYASWVHGYSSSGTAGWVSPTDWIRDRLAAYDYATTKITGGGDLAWNGSVPVTFEVRNTGKATWFTEGNANPTRAGTVYPTDHQSSFSKGGTASGWVGTNRIRLQANTAPGDIGKFTGTLVSNKQPGSYNLCFQLLAEGVGWMSGQPMCVGIKQLPPMWRAAWHKQTITTKLDPFDQGGQTTADNLLPGQKVNFKAYLKNTGELPWNVSGEDRVQMATSRPNDRPTGFATGGDTSIPNSENWPAHNRPSTIDGKYDPATNTITPVTQILPGEIAEFSWTMTVPDGNGSYKEYFNPVVEGEMWMNDIAMWYPLRIIPPGLHYDYVSQTNPGSFGLGSNQGQISVRLRNSGRTSWPVNGNLRLGTDRPLDVQSSLYTGTGTDPWVSPSRPSAVDNNLTVPGKTVIDPGETAEFKFTVTVPPLAIGTYNLYLRPVMDGVAWLPEDYGIFSSIKVTEPPYDYEVVYQSYGTSNLLVAKDGQATATYAIKNTGRTSWPTAGTNSVKLATSRPNDRQSAFASIAGADGWIAPNRASIIDARVTQLSTLQTTAASEIKPGEIAYFSVPMKASVPLGTYREYFNLVHDGKTWLPDYGIYANVEVRNNVPQLTNWLTDGMNYTSCVSNCAKNTNDKSVYGYSNYTVNYQTANMNAGSYRLALTYRNDGTLPPPSGYSYRVRLRINGTHIRTLTLPITAPGTTPVTQTFSSVTLPQGTSSVSLEWTNDSYTPGSYDANLGIVKVGLTQQ